MNRVYLVPSDGGFPTDNAMWIRGELEIVYSREQTLGRQGCCFVDNKQRVVAFGSHGSDSALASTTITAWASQPPSTLPVFT